MKTALHHLICSLFLLWSPVGFGADADTAHTVSLVFAGDIVLDDAAGELIRQGGTDRSLYFVEEGKLTVHYEDAHGRIRLAVVGPGVLAAISMSAPRRASSSLSTLLGLVCWQISHLR